MAIEMTDARLPQVGIVGDVYVRDNETFNQNLIRGLERAGAEAVTIPFIDTMGLLAATYFKSQWLDGSYMGLLRDKALYNTLGLLGRKLIKIARPLLKDDRAHPHARSVDVPAAPSLVHQARGRNIGKPSQSLLPV